MNKFGDKDYPWNKTQVIALAHSIEHWYKNWKNPEFSDITSSTCYCCNEFLYDTLRYSCVCCPIKLHTGSKYCRNTPWTQCNTTFTDIEVKKYAYEQEYKFLVEILLGERKPIDSNCP